MSLFVLVDGNDEELGDFATADEMTRLKGVASYYPALDFFLETGLIADEGQRGDFLVLCENLKQDFPFLESVADLIEDAELPILLSE